MEDLALYLLLLCLLIIIFVYKFYESRLRHKNLPPSPLAFPIIGHLHLLKPPIYRTLHQLAKKYGPIMSLRFGSRPVVVVSSPSIVEECFTKNDIVLANPPQFLLGKYVAYNYTAMSQSSYGDHWRHLRRIETVEIFSTHRLNMFLSIRQDEIKRLVIKLSHESTQDFAKVELKSMLKELTFNITVRMIAGKIYYGEDVTDEEEARKFRDLRSEMLSYGGASNPGDFLPFLNWIDGGKFVKKLKILGKRIDIFLQDLVNEHKYKKEKMEDTNSMIDHLPSSQQSQPEYCTDEIIKGLMQDMVAAGTDTSAVTLEWAISNILNHPKTLMKAREQIDNEVGQERIMEEHDIAKLPFLCNILLETLRLYSVAPLLAPHMSSEDCMVGGYNVPHGTILLVNAWSIHRDPTVSIVF